MTTTSEPSIPKTGRPRSAQSHRAIIDATLALLAEEGFAGMSIEAVAARAGVGKTTIYRRWDSKEALVLDALDFLEDQTPVVNTGNFRQDMLTMLHNNTQQDQDVLNAQIMPRLIGELATNPEFMRVYYAKVIAPRLRYSEDRIIEAQERGEIRADIPARLIFTLFAGPIFFDLMFGSVAQSSMTSPEQLIEVLWQGVGVQKD